MKTSPSRIKPIEWRDRADCLYVLDQRKLPSRESYAACRDWPAVAEAISNMTLRGAPLIGCAAAYGYALAARSMPGPRHRWTGHLEAARKALLGSRPTAVNLRNALERMRRRSQELTADLGIDRKTLFLGLKAQADDILAEDVESSRRMARWGAPLLPKDAIVMTHCNAGILATGGGGTALGVLMRARTLGRLSRVYSCETRPFLQGSRLTLWELMRSRIPTTLITDNMAAHIMSTEDVDAVVVGADRIAANGDTANKIGTYGLALLARHHKIPFYIVAPWTTVDMRCAHGAHIPIEERSPKEVLNIAGVRAAPRGASARHPAFDVTPNSLITAIVTDRGLARPPFKTALKRMIPHE